MGIARREQENKDENTSINIDANMKQDEQYFTPKILPTHKVNLTAESGKILSDITNNGNDKTPAVENPTIQGRVIIKAKRRSWGLGKNTHTSPETLRSAIAKLHTFEGVTLNKLTPAKEHSMSTRRDSSLKPTIDLRNRVVRRETLKRKGSSLSENKYQTLAEKIYHFENDIPPRFKYKPSSSRVSSQDRLTPTVAVSPNLNTKHRTLSPSTEEMETKESNDIKRDPIKARPLNRKIFQPPELSKPVARPCTVPVEFQLTQVKPKKPQKVECFQFKAQPAPKTTHLLTSSVQKKEVTKQKDASRTHSKQNSFSQFTSVTSQKSKVKPFSFEERDKLKQLEKEEKIRKIIQEESTIPTFHANPVPPFITRSSTLSINSTKVPTDSDSYHLRERSLHKKSQGEQEEFCQFKAKEPVVLKKEPFLPKKLDKPLTEPCDIVLNTEKRAVERQEFEKTLKEKEERFMKMQIEFEKEREACEKEELARLRKELVHKAKPMPNYPPVNK
ncbi:targeting protein for Xklp2 isoform X2 [Cimex lectularius]|uniref:TPX2 C-terminal domain-containing protein n=1 Tax=Cimex lectularius TaxID=79782 RepID=A0A8I6S8Y7_CIMLE|nr:targeting protein for Xklp2 isoform X2 [Cimex lectularius]